MTLASKLLYTMRHLKFYFTATFLFVVVIAISYHGTLSSTTSTTSTTSTNSTNSTNSTTSTNSTSESMTSNAGNTGTDSQRVDKNAAELQYIHDNGCTNQNLEALQKRIHVLEDNLRAEHARYVKSSQ